VNEPRPDLFPGQLNIMRGGCLCITTQKCIGGRKAVRSPQ